MQLFGPQRIWLISQINVTWLALLNVPGIVISIFIGLLLIGVIALPTRNASNHVFSDQLFWVLE